MRLSFLPAALAAVLLFHSRAFGQIAVGSGPNLAHVQVNFADGADYQFDVSFTGTTNGLRLFDLIEDDTTLTTVRQDFGFGIFIDGISYEGHSNSGYGGGENFWHYWTRESASAAWDSSFIGAGDRVVSDGSWDGWTYGTAATPVPEPATLGFIICGIVALSRKAGAR